MKRTAGVLLHITSLPSPYGIGTLGKAAEEFVDALVSAGQTYWQVLPLNPVGYGNSPYQSYSAFAGEPLLIDLDDLVANGLLSKKACESADYGADPTFVDFEKVSRSKMALLQEAHKEFVTKATGNALNVAYLAFVKEEEDWLNDYAVFMANKTANGGVSWDEWASASAPNGDEVEFWKFVQFFFYRQWSQLRRYANKNGVKIIGDIPIYASYDSADVYYNRGLFQLTEDGKPRAVAGVPPDYFSETGQLWGNPLYDWEAMKADGYAWWIRRVKKALALYDCVRIDHFRAFDTYWAIPYGDKTAVGGKWLNGPGMDLFNAINAAKVVPAGEYPAIIAEDLGELFDSVKELLAATGYPGMKILQFGMNGSTPSDLVVDSASAPGRKRLLGYVAQDNEHLSHNYINNMAVYTGTHDNSTIFGFIKAADKATLDMLKGYLKPHLFEPLNWACIRSLYASSAGMAIIPMQDIIGLDDSARMNVPGKVLPSNWIWRMKKDWFKNAHKKRLARLAKVYFRG
ncbi:MAG: 4-alpha-glucanotransferase [Oscillospiraceae bacterium]|nr:4-alpha-glucanotransferase [Oscillospiraceae bacterium]